MALDSDQVKLVKESFQILRTQTGAVGEAFYKRLFELNPDLELLFHIDMRQQRLKLMEAIGTVVDNLEQFDEIDPNIRELAVRHISYGVKIEDYEAVGNSLLWAIGGALGPAFTPEIKDAWTAAYLAVATSMKEAAVASAASE